MQNRLSFRLGEHLRFGIQANRDCHLTLIDFGTDGTVVVLWPNTWQKDPRLQGGRPYFLPQVDNPEFEFVVTGRPGVERAVQERVAPASRLARHLFVTATTAPPGHFGSGGFRPYPTMSRG